MAKLNPRELDVMAILWKAGKPMMATAIVNAGEGLTQSTVTAVLRVLLKEKLVEVAGITHSGRVLSRLYQPTEYSKEVLLQYFVDSYAAFSAVASAPELCEKILFGIDGEEKRKQEIARLYALLEEF